MPTPPTTLMPPARQQALRRAYFARFVVAGLALFSGLSLAAGFLLLPSYAVLRARIAENMGRLAALDAALAEAGGSALGARLAMLARDASVITALSTTGAATGALAALLDVPHRGVTLTHFAYAPRSGGVPASITLSGRAATRDALRQYARSLERAPFVSGVTLPVSAYAKDSDTPFTLTLTLALPEAELAP